MVGVKRRGKNLPLLDLTNCQSNDRYGTYSTPWPFLKLSGEKNSLCQLATKKKYEMLPISAEDPGITNNGRFAGASLCDKDT